MDIRKLYPLTKKELREAVACYATVFPDWKLIDGNRLERSFDPIVQQIGFEALRGGAYRSMGVIWAAPLPTVAMLHQFLDIKHDNINRGEHERKWKSVVTAMEQQFRPAIREPIDLREVLALCQQQARPMTNDQCMLAILHAYLGEPEQALACCDRIEAAEPPTLAPRPDWEERHKAFGRDLRRAIEQSKAREFLAWEQGEWECGNKTM